MHHQASQNSSASSGQGTTIHAAQYHHDPRTPYGPVYPQATNIGGRDNNATHLPQMFSGMNMSSHHAKYGPKNNASAPMNTNTDWAAANRASYNSPFIIFPNSTLFSGVPQVSSYVPGSVPGTTDQMTQYPYLPNGVYPNLNSMVPGAYSSWPYLLNYEIQDAATNKQPAWTSGDAHKGPLGENPGQLQYCPYSFVPSLDGASLSGYTYPNMFPSLGSLSIPFQVMKTPNGYVIQDLEALTQQEPGIPRAVPAMWTNPTELTLAKCLENREGITNVYIRGFLPETSDEMLQAYAARFGKIERCKAIVDLDTGLCKGFGFVQYYSFESCENCIRGFFYLGYQASYAQKSRNSRLKDLEDKSSTNIYCTNIPIDWTEANLRHHFEPYRVVSEKISRDEKTGVSKEVGFARFESREVAERVLAEFHNVIGSDNVKLLLRFADTKAQKMLKQQSNERRAYRAGEYNYSVEVVQGSTPSPSLMRRARQIHAHLTPNSQGSCGSPAGGGSNWTPATSISPTYALMKKPNGNARQTSLSSRSLNAIEHTPVYRGRSFTRRSLTDISGGSSKTMMPSSPTEPRSRSYMSSPRKENIKAGTMSPGPADMEILISTPRSCT
ncbi:Nucleotide-binding alpha-beta plait [Penicillium capsulatum]|uniref:Nucleotide-binding alpha-beta plait n=1 Tax=Penicillium capsulatum TaxID=69766 RepID=A0A9W9ISW3_9EURO|nr:Nucleotide-binding alpha-beta plait [Penicillium capsulatum]KAJ6129218.1 Nucleotide-binding alpha-beta plait [Penicillium capsulatum]